MGTSVALWQWGGFVFTAIVGSLLHFLFDWSGRNAVPALFSAVNESVWEHMKLLYYPAVLFAVVEYLFWGGDVEQFWCVKLAGLLFGLALIPVLYYTYTGALGVEADWFNIAIFFLAAAAVYWLESRLFALTPACQLPSVLCLGIILLIGAAFMLLTFVPPRKPLFADPVTGTYGYQPEE
jgi:hypothetical protein